MGNANCRVACALGSEENDFHFSRVVVFLWFIATIERLHYYNNICAREFLWSTEEPQARSAQASSNVLRVCAPRPHQAEKEGSSTRIRAPRGCRSLAG